MRRSLHRSRALRRALLAVALVALVHAALNSAGFRRWLTSYVEQEIAAQTGTDVTLGGVELRLWPPAVGLEGLLIRDGETGEVLFALSQGHAGLRLRGLKPRLDVLELDNPLIRLDLDALGGGDGGGSLPEELPWRQLLVRGGQIDLTWDSGRSRLQLAGLELAPAAAPWADLQRSDASVQKLQFTLDGVTETATGVSLPGVLLGVDRVEVPDLVLSTALLDAEGALAAELEGEGAIEGVLQVTVRGEGLTPWMPDGLSLPGEWLADLEVSGPLRDPTVQGGVTATPALVRTFEDGHTQSWRLGTLSTAFSLDRRGAALEPLRLGWAGGEIAAEVEVTFDDTDALGESSGPLLRSAVIRAEGLELATVMQEIGDSLDPWVDMRGDVELSLTGTLAPLSLSGDFEIAAEGLSVGEGPLSRSAVALYVPRGDARGQISIQPDRVTLDAARFSTGRSLGTVALSVGLSSRGPLEVALDFPRMDFADLAPLWDMELGGVGALRGEIRGPFDGLQIDGEIEAEGFTALGVPLGDRLKSRLRSDLTELRFEGFQLERGRTRSRGDLAVIFDREALELELDLLIPEGRLADMTGMFLEIPDTDAEIEGTVSLSGPIAALDGEARLEMRGVELFGERFHTGEAVGWMEEGVFTLETLRAQRRGALVLARGEIGPGWAMNIDLIADGLELAEISTLQSSPVAGLLSLDATVGGTLFSPAPGGRLRVSGPTLSGEPLGEMDLWFWSDDERLVFEGGLADGEVQIAGGIAMFGAQDYEVHAELRELAAHRLYPVAADGRPLEALLSGNVNVYGALGDAPETAAVDGVIDAAVLAWGGHRLTNPEPWRFRVRELELSLEQFALADEDGETYLQIGGYRTPSSMDIRGQGTLELEWLRALYSDVSRAEGLATLQLRVDGEPRNLKPRVDVQVRGGALRFDWFPHPLEDASLVASATAERYTIRTLSGSLGGGTLQADGVVEAEGWIPTRYAMDLLLEDSRIQYIDELPPVTGDAQLAFAGPADALLFSGEVVIDEMLFGERIDWEQWVLDFQEDHLVSIEDEATEAPLFGLDVHVTADGTIRLRNNVVQGIADADLRFVGDTNRVGLLGDVRLRSGALLILQEREFEVSRAELHYLDPWTFDPDLDFLMSTEVHSRAMDYDISYRVFGPFSNWRTEPSSNPPLSQGDINALLLFGVTQEELERQGNVGSALVLEGTDLFLSGLGLDTSGLERLGAGVFSLDRVEVASGVSERGPVANSEWRLLVEKELPDPWDMTLIGEIPLSRYGEYYWAVERNLTRNLYGTVFWATAQEGRSLLWDGAAGADFKVRWDLDY